MQNLDLLIPMIHFNKLLINKNPLVKRRSEVLQMDLTTQYLISYHLDMMSPPFYDLLNPDDHSILSYHALSKFV